MISDSAYKYQQRLVRINEYKKEFNKKFFDAEPLNSDSCIQATMGKGVFTNYHVTTEDIWYWIKDKLK